MEGWCDRWSELLGWGVVLLRVFVMAAELLLIEFLAVAAVFDFVTLINGVKQDNLAYMEFSVGKSSFIIVPVGNTGEGCGFEGMRWVWIVVEVATL